MSHDIIAPHAHKERRMTAMLAPEHLLTRAQADYLAVSRGAHLFELGAYLTQEEHAWQRLTDAICLAGERCVPPDDDQGVLRCTSSR
jgi:uncharacterized membrane protein YukC